MFRHYAKTLRQLHEKLHRLSVSPYSNNSLLLEIQHELIKKIKYVEGRVREAKSHSELELATDYQHLLHDLKSIGDGLAFLYIDRWDIKPLVYNNRSGFISGKSGFRGEVSELRKAIKNKPVLLADLTNCLRHGDLYEFQEGVPFSMVEVKRSGGGGRGHRQMNRNRRIVDYLNTDRADGTILKNTLLTRRALSIPLEDNVDNANKAIALALSEGFGSSSPEAGVVYIVDNGTNTERAMKCLANLDEPSVWFLNALKYKIEHFVPWCLLISDSGGFIRFLEGSLLITVAIEEKKLVQMLNLKGFKVELLNDYHFMQIQKDEGSPFRISGNFFDRVACEFLSLNWLVEELTHQYNKIVLKTEEDEDAL